MANKLKATMKIILTVLICLPGFSVIGQDTTYYDIDGNKVSSIEASHEYQIIERDDTDTNKVVERRYYNSGQIKSENHFNPYSEKTRHGKSKLWYERGQIQRDIDYKNGRLCGQILTYWENGQLKRSDTYKNGELIEGKVWNSDGQEVKYYDYEIMPKFPGGDNSFIRFLGKNLKYPRESRRKGIEGRVLLRFDIEKDGSISNIQIVESVNKELDAEAIRVIEKMPRWEPGMQDGEKVKIRFNAPIRFRLH